MKENEQFMKLSIRSNEKTIWKTEMKERNSFGKQISSE